jgi:ribonuclease HII
MEWSADNVLIPAVPDWTFENAWRRRGARVIVGVDEAGRGPLAGPVAAAAVVLPRRLRLSGLDDSKKLSEARREELFLELTGNPSVIWAVALAEPEEISALNILRATHVAMGRAVAALELAVDVCLIDGLPVPGFGWEQQAVVKGDGLSLSIAAASVLAKVTRDRLMHAYAEEFPAYGFERHKGYGTEAHLQALQIHGPCRIHRKTFQPIAQCLLPFDEV